MRIATRAILSISTGVLVLIAYASIYRVQNGQLFLFALPFERLPTAVEIQDAKWSAQVYFPAAIVGMLIIAVVLGWVVWHLFLDPTYPASQHFAVLLHGCRLLLIFFTFATTVDLATTLCFFHQHGVDKELHPGVRLVDYAYGRTVGPIIAKAFQFIGLVGLAATLRRFGPCLLLMASIFYIVGAAYNASQLLQLRSLGLAAGTWGSVTC